MSPTVREVILHCQKQIKKDKSEDRLLHYIGRLSRLKIGTSDLINTGIGRTINQLSREDGVVGKKAYALVTQWKALVEAERSSGSGSSSEDEAPPPPPKRNGRHVSDDEEEEDESSDDVTRSPPRKPKEEPVYHDEDEDEVDEDDDDEPALFIDQQPEPEPPVVIKQEPIVKSEPIIKSEPVEKKSKEYDQRKRRGEGESKEFEEKVVKKPKVEEKSPEKKADPHESLRPKLAPRLNVEIDSTSGINFSDVLSGLDTKRLKKSPKKVTPTKKSSSSAPSSGTPSSGTPERSQSHHPASSNSSSKDKVDMDKDNGTVRNIAKVLPFAYTPPPSTSKKVPVPIEHAKVLEDLSAEAHYWDDSHATLNGSYGTESNDDALAKMMASRNQRTKVYSGVKSGVPGKVPTLFKMCLHVVQDNIGVLEDTGGIPFYILEPVLRRITLQQLMHVEHYNSYLIESTDDIWKYHCSQNFRGKTPRLDEMETWRDLYYRCVDERSARFESLTSKLKTKLAVATPERKAKLAYVEANSKGTKFSKSKAATIKTGMSSLKTREEKGPARTHGSSASSGGGGNNNVNMIIEPAAVIIGGNGRSRTGGNSGGGGGGSSSSVVREVSMAAKKPKKAPLMQKTLKSMKTLMRR